MDKIEQNIQNFSDYPFSFPCCVWDRVCKTYCTIKKYNKETNAIGKKFKRTYQFLSIPKYYTRKFQPQIIRRFKRTIEHVYLHKRWISTRLQQLALTQLRRLMDVKREFGSFLGRRNKEALNRLMRETTFSMYARLANVIPPKPKPKIYKWTKEDWEYMNKQIKALATPKKLKIPPKIIRKKQPINEFIRTEFLALPNVRIDSAPREWIYKKSMRTYPVTERLHVLATPKRRSDNHYKDPMKISRGALKYKISQRTNTLAKHRTTRTRDSDLRSDAFEIPRNALKYKASARILELAEPKEYPKIEFNTGEISPAALKYKTTSRIIKLAKPRSIREKYKPS